MTNDIIFVCVCLLYYFFVFSSSVRYTSIPCVSIPCVMIYVCYFFLVPFLCLVSDNRMCQMRRRMIGKKYKQIQIYLFNDLFVWVSARGKFKGSYSFYDPNVCICVLSLYLCLCLCLCVWLKRHII